MTREVSSAPLVDQFTKHMEDKENAEKAIRSVIPAFFLANFRMETLKLVPIPFSSKIREGISTGIVYECRSIRNHQLVFALLLDAGLEEHRNAHFDVMNFKIEILEHFDGESFEMVPIVPILFWPGSEPQTYHPWETLFEGGRLEPELKRHMPNGDYIPANFAGTPG